MIPGVTDKPRLKRLGKIRLGEKATSRQGSQYPKALDHFSFRDVPELEKLFGAECREIYPVILPSEDEETWFQTSRSAYTKSGLFCRCVDGETATRTYKGKDDKGQPLDPQGQAFIDDQGLEVEPGEMFDMPCPGEECWYYRHERRYCKPLGRLMIVIVNSPRFGVYEIQTSSINSIRNLLNSVRSIHATAGRITGIPLALQLKPHEVSPEGRKKTVYVLDLEFRDGGLPALLGAAKRAATNPTALLGNGGEVERVPEEVPEDLYADGGAALGERLGDPPPPEREKREDDPQEEPLNDPRELFTDTPPPEADAPRKEEHKDRIREAARKATGKGQPSSPQPEPEPEPEPPKGNRGSFFDF